MKKYKWRNDEAKVLFLQWVKPSINVVNLLMARRVYAEVQPEKGLVLLTCRKSSSLFSMSKDDFNRLFTEAVV